MSAPPPESPVAIITGASRGIGQATAHELAREGYRVTVISRSEADLRKAVQGVSDVLVLALDVAQADSPDVIVARTLDRFGRIDLLVNNAGMAPLRSIEQTTPDVWHQAIDTNLTATFFLTRACWPVFVRQGSGVVVNVSSVAARDPFPGFFAYGAAKAGVNTLGLALAREGATHNIRVHTVAPGATDTEMFRSLPGMRDFPVDKTMDPHEVARVIVACARGELTYTSGEVIYLHRGA
jgi:3-oxoacyl-[acyl-carrier protein] reductase